MRSSRWRLSHLLAALAAALLSFAAVSAQGEDAAGEDHPSAWDCTPETLVAERECYLGGEAQKAADPAAQGRENTKIAASWAAGACAKAARVGGKGKPDPALYGGCLQAFQTAALEACSLDGLVALVDARGRFASEANACYVALSQVTRHTRMLATLSAPCCRCLAKTCGQLGECDEELLAQEPGAQVTQCLARGSCQGACGQFVKRPAADEDEAPPVVPPASTRRKADFTY